MSMQGKLTIERMCRLAGVSQAGFYRSLEQQQPVKADMQIREEIHQIFLEHKRHYGYRRVSAELRRRGLPVNHKRVARLMREDNLLAVQPKSFVATTDSEHDCEVFFNLAKRMELTGINQLWVADITYIPAPGRVRVPGRDSGCLFSQGHRMGTGSYADSTPVDRGPSTGTNGASATVGFSASLRSRHSIRVRRIRVAARQARSDSEHKPAGEPL